MYKSKSPFQLGKSLARIARFCGNSRRFYTVFQHSLAVAEMVPAHLKCLALIHDISESWVSDIPTPVKPDCIRRIEAEILNQFYQEQHIKPPTDEDKHTIHLADRRALFGEIYQTGVDYLWSEYPVRDYEAENITIELLNNWSTERLIDSYDAAHHFDHLFRNYKI